MTGAPVAVTGVGLVSAAGIGVETSWPGICAGVSMAKTDPTLAGYRPFFHQLGELGPVGSDLQLRHVAFVQATAHPAKYALNLAANLGRMLFGFPFSFTCPDTGTMWRWQPLTRNPNDQI